MEKLLDWIGLFDDYLMEQWNNVIYMFSKFHRSKLTKKEYSANSKKDEKKHHTENNTNSDNHRNNGNGARGERRTS